jgi:hypothetical protein
LGHAVLEDLNRLGLSERAATKNNGQ